MKFNFLQEQRHFLELNCVFGAIEEALAPLHSFEAYKKYIIRTTLQTWYYILSVKCVDNA